jgi:hypothetical protein
MSEIETDHDAKRMINEVVTSVTCATCNCIKVHEESQSMVFGTWWCFDCFGKFQNATAQFTNFDDLI